MSDTLPASNETTVPLLPCTSLEETEEFYLALGFTQTYRMTRPYLYLVFEWRGIALHFSRAPAAADPTAEDLGGALVLVDRLAPYHAALTTSLRAHYGRVPASGRPRITRYRAGASRFSIVDPSGNSIIFIQRDEPADLDYGGSQELEGLAKYIDNARIFREFKNDDSAARRTLENGLRKFGDTAPALQKGRALAALVELATANGDREHISALRDKLVKITLTEAEQLVIAAELGETDTLAAWLAGSAQAPGSVPESRPEPDIGPTTPGTAAR